MAKELKDIPADNKGLPKLDKKVRNQIGYKKDGGAINGLKKMGMKKGGLAGRLAQRGYGKARSVAEAAMRSEILGLQG